ncbi:MAG: response regulator [Gammaproteobacteria bacterium]|jgi:CheY-like chemotaxis protein
MSDKKIACCFYPTKVIVIDDQQSYLNRISLEIGKDIDIDCFAEAKEAVDFLKKQPKVDFLSSKLLSSLKDRENIGDLENDYIERAYTAINVFDIHKMIYNTDRFKQIIVIIVDYAMPEMDGLQVSEALKNIPFKIIMLTGKAPPDVVIKAFNAGFIHRYVSKDSSDFKKELENAIFDLQKAYFYESSETAIKSLAISPTSCLGDTKFAEFFNEFCRKENVVEYYLMNEAGSYLLLDMQGNPSILAVKTERDMSEYAEIARDYDAPQKITEALTSYKKLLFLFNEDDQYNVPIENWDDYSYPATKLKGDKDIFYYSHIKNVDKYDIDKSKIVSYQSFLEA